MEYTIIKFKGRADDKESMNDRLRGIINNVLIEELDTAPQGVDMPIRTLHTSIDETVAPTPAKYGFFKSCPEQQGTYMGTIVIEGQASSKVKLIKALYKQDLLSETIVAEEATYSFASEARIKSEIAIKKAELEVVLAGYQGLNVKLQVNEDVHWTGDNRHAGGSSIFYGTIEGPIPAITNIDGYLSTGSLDMRHTSIVFKAINTQERGQ